MPAGRSTRLRSCSGTPRSPRRRFTPTPTLPGCGPPSTRCPARVSWPGGPGDRRELRRPAADSPARTAVAAVLGDSCVITGPAVVRLAALLDPGFLAGAGWDPVTWVLAPPAGHRLIRWDCSRLDARSGPSGRQAPLPVLGGSKCAVLACLRARRAGQRRQGG